jgi:hypothetical protein
MSAGQDLETSMGSPGRVLSLLAAGMLVAGCADSGGVSLAKRTERGALHLHERVPDQSEAATIGAISGPIERGSPEFGRLIRCGGPEIVFKDEEGTGADRMMTPRLHAKLGRLSRLVIAEWPELRLRVTEAWDERHEHGEKSEHYEGRAADITTSDADPDKLGRLGWLAREAGLEWVLYESVTHVHVSVQR